VSARAAGLGFHSKPHDQLGSEMKGHPPRCRVPEKDELSAAGRACADFPQIARSADQFVGKISLTRGLSSSWRRIFGGELSIAASHKTIFSGGAAQRGGVWRAVSMTKLCGSAVGAKVRS